MQPAIWKKHLVAKASPPEERQRLQAAVHEWNTPNARARQVTERREMLKARWASGLPCLRVHRQLGCWCGSSFHGQSAFSGVEILSAATYGAALGRSLQPSVPVPGCNQPRTSWPATNTSTGLLSTLALPAPLLSLHLRLTSALPPSLLLFRLRLKSEGLHSITMTMRLCQEFYTHGRLPLKPVIEVLRERHQLTVTASELARR